MFEIPVFKPERDAGLTDLVRASACIAYACQVELCAGFDMDERALSRVNKLGMGRAKADQKGSYDLHYLKSLLVSTTWNKNDDIFLPSETWAARATPVDKPINDEHAQGEIVGHMTSSLPVDDDRKVIAEDIALEDLPPKFHLVTGGVLYKYWDDPKHQERMDLILAEIADKKRFVSMECLLRGFDYALKASDGTFRVVARNQATAHLTKHLRLFGGKGEWEGQKLGRVLRNFVFSGKGLVKKPANVESIIFDEDDESVPAAASLLLLTSLEINSQNSRLGSAPGYFPTEDEIPQIPTNSKGTVTDMADTIEALQAKVETLTKELANKDVEGVKAKLTEATAALASKEEELKTLKADLASKDALVATATKSVEDFKVEMAKKVEEHAAIAAELNGIKFAKAKAERVASIKAALKVDEKDEKAVAAAVEMVDALVGLSDEKFAAHIQSIAKLTPAPFAPKMTPAPLPPATTPGKPEETGTAQGSETDPKEVVADPAVLDTAVAAKNAALSVPVTDSGVNDVQRQVAAYFGCTDEE